MMLCCRVPGGSQAVSSLATKGSRVGANHCHSKSAVACSYSLYIPSSLTWLSLVVSALRETMLVHIYPIFQCVRCESDLVSLLCAMLSAPFIVSLRQLILLIFTLLLLIVIIICLVLTPKLDHVGTHCGEEYNHDDPEQRPS